MEHSPVVGAGLKNIGKTCYMNSVLQCMMRTEELVKKLWSTPHECSCNGEFCTVCELKNLIEASIKNTGSEYSPEQFAGQLSNFSKDFVLGHPADAQEYLRCFLDKIDNSSQNQMVDQVFGGHFRSQLKCIQCGHFSHSYEPFLDISLRIDESVRTVEDSLRAYVQTEFLKARCAGCKETVSQMEKNFLVSRAPAVLTLHLKRIDNVGRKIDREVAYPLDLDLAPFLMPSENHVETKYELFALIEHEGTPTEAQCAPLTVGIGSAMFMSHVLQKKKQQVGASPPTCCSTREKEQPIKLESQRLFPRKNSTLLKWPNCQVSKVTVLRREVA